MPGTHNSTGLAKQYDKHLANGKLLTQIPSSPIHVFCSTDLAYGVNWMFKKQQSGDYEAGFQDTPAGWTVGSAVAASSCFPPVFKPLHLNLDPKALKGGNDQRPIRDKIVREIAFSDGGVYDNLGLEPIWKDLRSCWLPMAEPCSGSAARLGLLGEIGRYIEIPEIRRSPSENAG